MRQKFLFILALLLTAVTGAWADNWDVVYRLTQTTSANWTALNAGSSTGYTIGTAGTTTYYYATGNLSFTNSTVGGSGLTIRGTVYLYIPSGKTVRCTGAKANNTGITGGGAGVELAAGNTLYLLGDGRLEATGGDGESGNRGDHGEDANFEYDKYCQPGSGGRGGDGGGGGGAGIGTRGGNGGAGGAGGSAKRDANEGTNKGVAGSPGSNGDTAGSMGTLYVYQGWNLSVVAKGGGAGWFTSARSNRGKNAAEDPYNQYAASGGGGGGTSGNGSAGSDIGTGGGGGGGGGGGAAGNSTWRDNVYNGFYRVGAGGGKGGGNYDGDYAWDGGSSELSNPYDAELNKGLEGTYDDDGWEKDNGAAAGGSGGTCGAASKSGSAVNLVLWPTQGAGTEESPYLISSADDWNTFVTNVNNGISFSGKVIKQTNDISVSNMAGGYQADDNYQPFSGTFDGDGHTLTINLNNQSRFAAPFKCVSGATIRNLHTTGTIDGTGNSDGKLLAGLIGISFGNTTITGCRSSMTLTTDFGEDAAMAGLVAGTKGGSLTIEGCVFDGSMTGSSNTRCAGIAGYEYGGTTTTISNCLFIPATLTVSTADDSYTKTFTRDPDATITNCYYTQPLGAAQGTEATASATAPANLGNLVQNYGIVKAYANGILVGGTYYVAPASISLANAADNSTTISNANGYVANVTLSGRTLYKDGKWNTVCLPFDVTLVGSPLAGATARPLESASISGTTLNLNFDDPVTTLKAGTPYIIKWTKADDYVDDNEHNIVSPVFSGVTIDKTDRSYDNAAEGDARVRFIGTYKSTTFTAADNSILLLGGENKLYYPAAGAGIGAQRAYFKIGDDGAAAPRLTGFSIYFGDDEATGIISTTNYTNYTNSDAWFTLDGRKLSGKPTAKGLYIVNGKKVIVK